MQQPEIEKVIKITPMVKEGVADEEIREDPQEEIGQERELKVIPPSREAPGKILQGKPRGPVTRKPRYPGRVAMEILKDFALKTANDTIIQLTLGEANWGWGRIQLHSSIQQLIRQSPFYYLIYVALRPDHAQRLISYPYYMKDQAASDEESTRFHHINGNLRLMAEEGKGINLIQKLVFIDDEQKDDCIELALRHTLSFKGII